MPRPKKTSPPKPLRTALGTAGRTHFGERPSGPSPRVGASLSAQDRERLKRASTTLEMQESTIIRLALTNLLESDLSSQSKIPRPPLGRAGRPRLGEAPIGRSQRIGVVITEQDLERLTQASETLAMTEAELIRIALIQFLNNIEIKYNLSKKIK